jgi:hypothetical protein
MASRRILVLYWCELHQPLRATIRQHLRLFEASPTGHRVHYWNVALGVPRWVRQAAFDVVVLHTTLLCARWFAQAAEVRRDLDWLSDSAAFKIALPQDEYDHSAVLDDWVADLNVDLVGTNFGPAHRADLYPRAAARARFLAVLTGYVDPAAAAAVAPAVRPATDRPFDVVYRAAQLPYWFGHHGQLKHRIGAAAIQVAADLGLRADVSVNPGDTIHSDQWYKFLASGRATVGCESGSSALDQRGEIQAAVRRLLTDCPELSFEQVSARLPAGWDGYRFFAVGPRHLEAVITRTCQVLVRGEYDGLLKAGVHYVPVRPDLADLPEALAAVRDAAHVDRMTQRAFEDVYLAGKLTYATVAGHLDAEMAARPARRQPGPWDAKLRVRLRLSTAVRRVARLTRGVVRRARRRWAGPHPTATGVPTSPAAPVQ